MNELCFDLDLPVTQPEPHFVLRDKEYVYVVAGEDCFDALRAASGYRRMEIAHIAYRRDTGEVVKTRY